MSMATAWGGHSCRAPRKAMLLQRSERMRWQAGRRGNLVYPWSHAGTICITVHPRGPITTAHVPTCPAAPSPGPFASTV